MKVVMEEIRTKNIKLYNIQNSNSNMIELNSLIGKGEIGKTNFKKSNLSICCLQLTHFSSKDKNRFKVNE